MSRSVEYRLNSCPIGITVRECRQPFDEKGKHRRCEECFGLRDTYNCKELALFDFRTNTPREAEQKAADFLIQINPNGKLARKYAKRTAA